MTQQPTIDRSVGGAVTLVEAAAIVTAEARVRAWWLAAIATVVVLNASSFGP